MALSASKSGVRAGQRVIGINRVIEGDVRPVGRGVASFAGRRKHRSHMVWICGATKVLLVTAVAVGRKRSVVVICVALGALNGRVRAGKREYGAVIKRGRRPCGCRMA